MTRIGKARIAALVLSGLLAISGETVHASGARSLWDDHKGKMETVMSENVAISKNLTGRICGCGQSRVRSQHGDRDWIMD
jgi:hypothetical protein